MYPLGNYGTDKEITRLNIDKVKFESFIKKEKQYLNPGLRISDLTIAKCTNRSYLSCFINRTYGMSFSRYINNCKWIELQRMEKDFKGSEYEKETLIIKAGFRSLREYNQFIKQEKKAYLI